MSVLPEVLASLADGSIGWTDALLGATALALGAALFLSRRHNRRLVRELRRTDELIDNLSEGIYRSTLDGRQLRANPALVHLHGYDTEAQLLASVNDIGREWYVEPRRREEFRRLLRRDGRVEHFESEILRQKTGERIWISESARLVHHEKNGKALFYEGSVREITETTKRLQLEARFSKLMSQVPGALFQFTATNGTHVMDYVSPGIERVTGLAQKEIMADPLLFNRNVDPQDIGRFIGAVETSMGTMEAFDIELRFGHRDGTTRWLRLTASPERVEAGITFHGYLGDISVRKANEMEIARLAYHDPLTDLPNRRMCMDRIARAMRDATASGQHGALLFVDLDNFKALNDRSGHDAGDGLLREVARRLKGCVEPHDMVARIGGDEFVIMLEGLGGTAAMASADGIIIANRLTGALREPFQSDGEACRVTASVGLVVFDGNEARPGDLVKAADAAMYRAKAAGRDGVAIAQPGSRRDAAPAPRPAAIEKGPQVEPTALSSAMR